MDEELSAEAAAAEAELALVVGLTRSVAGKVDHVCGDLAAMRRHLQAVACLAEAVLAQVPPPNPVHADAAETHARARALLAVPSLSLLDY